MQPDNDPSLAEPHLRYRAECSEQGRLRVGERALQGARAAVACARTAARGTCCCCLTASSRGMLACLCLAASLRLEHADAACAARLADPTLLRKQPKPAGRTQVRAGAELGGACWRAMAVASGRGCRASPLRLRILHGQLHALPLGAVAASRLHFGAAVAIRQCAGLLHRASQSDSLARQAGAAIHPRRLADAPCITCTYPLEAAFCKVKSQTRMEGTR